MHHGLHADHDTRGLALRPEVRQPREVQAPAQPAGGRIEVASRACGPGSGGGGGPATAGGDGGGGAGEAGSALLRRGIPSGDDFVKHRNDPLPPNHIERFFTHVSASRSSTAATSSSKVSGARAIATRCRHHSCFEAREGQGGERTEARAAPGRAAARRAEPRGHTPKGQRAKRAAPTGSPGRRRRRGGPVLALALLF